MRTFLLLVAILLTTSACNSKIKGVIGLETPGPDEYRTKPNKSLELPPHYELPPIQTEGEKISHDKKVAKDLNEAEEALIKEIRSGRE